MCVLKKILPVELVCVNRTLYKARRSCTSGASSEKVF
eukprot:jgi/Antlo1/1808/16